ncbi:hypothetical protein C9J12_28780 [Photobacterium frigidiphilum]|uniref:Uncharacterized protein n=2 Tax=Photobacterium frigidiphilum TaxID=264736 RepID=A0A2T3J660_9GAMM|nr:hypothetical protein C9J12_28780 [Photobacterium frigidiphilum]
MKISHENKFIIDIIIPLFISMMTCFILYEMSFSHIIGDGKIIDKISSLLGILIGFFIASLAAVSTFDRPEMDHYMKGTPPTLNKKPLTSRQFLCYLFGYLSFITIITILTSDLINVFSGALIIITKNNSLLAFVIFMPYFFVVTNILMTLFLGLSFLTDDIHKRENTIINKVLK